MPYLLLHRCAVDVHIAEESGDFEVHLVCGVVVTEVEELIGLDLCGLSAIHE